MSDPATAVISRGAQPGSLYIQNDFEVDGKIYGDGSQLTSLPAGGAAGVPTNVQYNNSGIMAGSDTFVFNGTNIGVGTSVPLAQLQVGTGAASMALASALGANDALVKGRLEVDSTVYINGNVGIGTIGPIAKLNIQSATEQLRTSYNSANYNSMTTASNGILSLSSNGTTNFKFGNDPIAGYSDIWAGGIAAPGSGNYSWQTKNDGSEVWFNVPTGGYIFFTVNNAATALKVSGATPYVGVGYGSAATIPVLLSVNGNAYVVGNVGISTTAPRTKLEVDGTIYGTNIGIGTTVPRALLEVGRAAGIVAGSLPAALVKGDLVVDGKIYGDGSGLTGVVTANPMVNNVPKSSGTALIDSVIYSVGNNVGISSSAPQEKLVISGSGGTRFLVTDSSSFAAFRLSSPVGSTAAVDFAHGVTNYWGFGMRSTGGNDFLIWDGTNDLTRFAIKTSTGNVGIGTTTPLARLHIGGTGSLPNAMISTGSDLYVLGNIEFDGRIYGDGSGLSGTSTLWDVIGDPAGNGSVAFGSTAQTMDWATATTQNAMAMTGNVLSTGKLLTLSTTATASLTTAGANAGSLLDITASGALSAFTGSLASINASGANTVGSTGNALAINIAGAAQLMKGIYFTDATTGNLGTTGGTSGAVVFSMTGNHTGYGFQVSDVTTAGTAMVINVISLTTGTGEQIAGNALTSGTLLDIGSNGTGGLTGQKGLNILMTGANGTAGQTTYGAYLVNTHSGGISTNVGLYATATGGTTANYAAIFQAGNVGVGITTPTHPLETSTASVSAYVPVAGFFAPSNTTAGNASQIRFGVAQSNGNAAEWRYVYQASNNALNRTDFGFYGYAAPVMSYLVSGNVGIGTTVPLSALVVGVGRPNAMPVTGGDDVYVAGNIELDGRIYGDGSGLTGISSITNWDVIGDPSGAGSIAFGSTVQTMDWATATTQNALSITGNGLSSGTLLNISSNGTAALTGQKGLNIALSGTNSSATQTTYGAYISNAHAGATSTNVALYAEATGGTSANYAAIFNAGNVGIGTAAPVSTLEIAPAGTLAVPQGTAPSVSKAGQVAVDVTDDQFVYYGTAKRVLPYERTICVTIENLAAADDNFGFFSAPDNMTLARGWCHCQGTCTTEATITLETVQVGTAGPTVDAVGGTITCADMVAGASATTLTADNTVDALDVLRFDVTNTPSPPSDEYTLCVVYTFDAQ
jgi:hypothetical protein